MSNTNNTYVKGLEEGYELCHNLFIYKTYGYITINDIEVLYIVLIYDR